MPNDSSVPFNRPPADRGAIKTTRLVWLGATFTLFAAVVALAMAVAVVVLPARSRAEAADRWVDHTQQVIIAIGNLMASATDAESSQRAFLLTTDPGFLERYDRAVRDVWQHFSNLQIVTSDNPIQQSWLTVLDGQLHARLAVLAHTIDLARNGESKAASGNVHSGPGKALMDAIRVTAADMLAEEDRLLGVRRDEQARIRQASNEIFLMLMLFGILGILMSGGASTWAVLAASTRRRSAAANAERLRLLNLLDLAPIMVRDVDGTVRFWSEGCRRLYGWTAEQAIGRLAQQLLQTVFRVSPEEIQTDLLARHEWSGELDCRTQDGMPVTVLAHQFLEENLGSGSPGVLEIVTDVTELCRFEADLRTSQVWLDLFFDNAPAAIAMFDNAMCYIAASRRFMVDYHLGDKARTALVGRSHYELFPELSDRWRSIHSRVLAGETLSSEAEPFPCADGRIDWVRWEMVPWRNADGTIGGALLLSEDMTERMAAEAALHDSAARLRLVQQVCGIAFTDRTLPETSALISREFTHIYGLPPEQTRIPVAAIVALVHPDDQDMIGAITTDSLERGGKFTAEFRICRPDGAVRWINLRTESFLGPAGRPNRIISAQQDITEIVAAREVLAARHDELERSNADLEEFAYTVSHDLRAPLRAIAHLAQWIGDDMKQTATPELTESLNLLQGRVVRMQKLLEGLLAYSRAGQIDQNTENVAISDVVANIVAMQVPPPGFVVTYEGEELILSTQPVAIQVVLENLVSNGLKHHDRTDGRIVVSARRVDRLVEFRVADDGPGIPAQFHQRIFGMFQTLQSRDDREASGIGLAVVKRKVEIHGGHIWIESAPTVRGTTFIFTWKETTPGPTTVIPLVVAEMPSA
jgi:PAS domain S-box-containing protein